MTSSRLVRGRSADGPPPGGATLFEIGSVTKGPVGPSRTDPWAGFCPQTGAAAVVMSDTACGVEHFVKCTIQLIAFEGGAELCHHIYFFIETAVCSTCANTRSTLPL